MSTIIKSVSVSLEMDNLMKEYKISPSEAFRVGISVILSDLGEPQYLNRLNIGRKLSTLARVLQETQEKLNKYEAMNDALAQK